MREIEFRGKAKSNGQWVYGSLLIDEIQNIICIVDNKGGIGYEVDPETVGQYIRRKDKNDKKIYENDIVIAKCKDLTVKGKVLFEEITNSFYIENILGIDCKFFGNLEIYILGNVSDNPELLEGKEVKS